VLSFCGVCVGGDEAAKRAKPELRECSVLADRFCSGVGKGGRVICTGELSFFEKVSRGQTRAQLVLLFGLLLTPG
jgi:hypothetical protein